MTAASIRPGVRTVHNRGRISVGFLLGKTLAVGLGGLVVLVSLVPPIPLHAATKAIAPSLAREVLLVGDEGGAIRVDVPKGTSLDMTHDSTNAPRAVDIVGDGRLVGFHLVPEDPESSDGILVLRLSEMVGSTQHWAAARVGGESCRFTVCELAPGPYLLYLVADGAPIQVTLEFGGLAGETLMCLPRFCPDPDPDDMEPKFHTLAEVDIEIESPPPSVDLAQSPLFGVRSAGTDTVVDGREFLLVLGYGSGEQSLLPPPGPQGPVARVEHGLCIYHGPAPSQGFLPGCPDSSTPVPTIPITSVFSGYGYVDSWLDNHPTSTIRGLGGYQTGIGVIDSFGVLILQVDRLS